MNILNKILSKRDQHTYGLLLRVIGTLMWVYITAPIGAFVVVLGELVTDENGEAVREPGTLKSVKAIGWYIEEYAVAQISMNLTNMNVTPVHIAFDEVCRKATERGVRVTGSELVGLIPLKAMLDAGRYFLNKQGRSEGVSEEELIFIAIKSMGLDELGAFNPQEKIIEYKLRNIADEKLVNMTLKEFANETASESPAPGGGSIAAYVASLGMALGTMVANLSAGKRGWEDRKDFFSEWAINGQELKKALIAAVDEDTRAFNRIMEAFGLPKGTDEEKKARTQAIEDATKYACDVPYKVMELAYSGLVLLEQMIEKGNPNSITDAGVGVLCVKTAVRGAYFNVLVNAQGLKDRAFADDIKNRAQLLLATNHTKADELIAKVEEAIK